jgi:hypothetical protein
MLLPKAIEAAGSDVNNVNQELHATRNYKGASGTFPSMRRVQLIRLRFCGPYVVLEYVK